MHKSFTFLLIFYGHTLQLWKRPFISASVGKYVVPGTHLAGAGHLLSLVPPSGIPYLLMSAIPSLRQSFALNSKLTSSALPMDLIYCLASLCTSELYKKDTIKL